MLTLRLPLFFVALSTGAAFAEDTELQVGRFQALVGSEIRDDDQGSEDPGIWIVDTATGGLAFCQSGLVNMVKTDDGYTIGEPAVSCTPWHLPSAGNDLTGIHKPAE
jgi:hypothetical protein